MRTTALWLALVLLGAGCASLQDEGADPEVESFPLVLRSDDHPDVVSVTVVDARTGRPIENAVVRGFAENVDGRAAAVNAQLLTMATDHYGLAVGRTDTRAQGASHWVVSAKGYRPYARYHGYWPPERVDLEPSTPVAVRVLDSFGNPAAHAEVEGYSGCPHAPAVVQGVTDRDGVFRAADGSPDGFTLWARAPGCARTAEELPAVFGDEPCHELLQPGIIVRGRLRDQTGRAIPGAVLRGANYPRGPSTVTDPEGRFVLAGLEPQERIQVFHPTLRLPEAHVVERSTDDIPLDLTWTVEGLGRAGKPGTLVIRARGPDGSAAENLHLLVVGPDGQGREATTNHDGEAVLVLTTGRYRVRGDDPFGPFEVAEATVAVPPDGRASLDLVLAPRSCLRIEGEAPSDLHAVVVTAGREQSLSSCDESPARLWLPARGRAVVVLRDFEQAWTHFVPIGPVVGNVRTVRLDIPTAHRIRLVDDGSLDGADAGLSPQAHPRVERSVRITGGVIRVRWGGRFHLTVRREDGRPARIVSLELPPLAAGAVERRINLDRDAVAENNWDPATLIVRRADGRPLPELSVSGGEVGAAWKGFSNDGCTSPIDVAVPSRVLLHAPGLHPLQVDVTRPGQHETVFPAGGIDLTLVDGSGAPVASAILVNGVQFEAPKGHLSLRGFAAGDHAVVVQRTSLTPPVTGSVRWRFGLSEGEVRARTLILP